MIPVKVGDKVFHEKYGHGEVKLLDKDVYTVKYENGAIKESVINELKLIETIEGKVSNGSYDAPYEAYIKTASELIENIDLEWGVFAASKIQLLPHQLWVCNRLLQKKPARMLIADDVGLGKTIEAGLYLKALMTKNIIKRFLIICPANLVPQWQQRMRKMFGIGTHPYSSEVDTENSDFWNTADRVVASLHNLRLLNTEKQEKRLARILEADKWDLLIVDEAHHLNALEDGHHTAGYQLIKSIVDENKVNSVIFFTGTPHRGKDYGFFALLNLIDKRFDPEKSTSEQYKLLSDVMIRNNKSNVTDLEGNKLFKKTNVEPHTYDYNEEESLFYELLTDFIVSGKAYASSQSAAIGSAVMLVLIAMQKLASSSVAAIKRAIKGRIERTEIAREKISKKEEILKLLKKARAEEEAADYDPGDDGTVGNKTIEELEEEIAQDSFDLVLMEDEAPRLRELLKHAENVKTETKIESIMSVVKDKYPGQSILFFTEYKATQSLLMGKLIDEFGKDPVGFINGDGEAKSITLNSGVSFNLKKDRKEQADKFNRGDIKYLVSTEAAGEGIDLQGSCHILIHVDLPWNPMRMHQRVGRLNRYGQKEAVSVLSFRNPSTVEARVWERLNEKIERINKAFESVMPDPEDMYSLVLGLESPRRIEEAYLNASAKKEGVDDWFDKETGLFEGKELIETVKAIIGNVNKFDFGKSGKNIPRLDLEDLVAYCKNVHIANKKRLDHNEECKTVTIRTPESWIGTEVSESYSNVSYDRKAVKNANDLLSANHPFIKAAIKHGKELDATISLVDGDTSILVFRIFPKIMEDSYSKSHCFAAVKKHGGGLEVLKDWEALKELNKMKYREKTGEISADAYRNMAKQCTELLESRLNEIDHGFKDPRIELYSAFLGDKEAR